MTRVSLGGWGVRLLPLVLTAAVLGRSVWASDAVVVTAGGDLLSVGHHGGSLWLGSFGDLTYADGRRVNVISRTRPEGEAGMHWSETYFSDPAADIVAGASDLIDDTRSVERRLGFVRHVGPGGSLHAVPLWPLVVLAAIWPAATAGRRVWTARQRPAGACPTCGYDLTGTRAAGIGRCPECGTPVVVTSG